jgi:predicted HicB family RNase H-like nuclease
MSWFNLPSDKSKSSISKASSYQEIGKLWDNYSLADYWDETQPVEFEIDLNKESRFYYKIDQALSRQLIEVAKQQGISANQLVNLWIEEKLQTLKDLC